MPVSGAAWRQNGPVTGSASASLARRFASILVSLLLTLTSAAQAATVPTGFQDYRIVGDDQQVWDMLDRVCDGETGSASCQDASSNFVADAMLSVVTITVSSDDQVIYYDQWEDGTDTGIPNSSPSDDTTLIFGDSNTANGRACDYINDIACDGSRDDEIFEGETLTLSSEAISSFSASDGSLQWATDWMETSDDDDLTDSQGDIFVQIETESARIGDVAMLNLRNASSNEPSIEREFSLDGATDVTLDFDLAEDSVDGATDDMVLAVSNDGGGSWCDIFSHTTTAPRSPFRKAPRPRCRKSTSTMRSPPPAALAP